MARLKDNVKTKIEKGQKPEEILEYMNGNIDGYDAGYDTGVTVGKASGFWNGVLITVLTTIGLAALGNKLTKNSEKESE